MDKIREEIAELEREIAMLSEQIAEKEQKIYRKRQIVFFLERGASPGQVETWIGLSKSTTLTPNYDGKRRSSTGVMS